MPSYCKLNPPQTYLTGKLQYACDPQHDRKISYYRSHKKVNALRTKSEENWQKIVICQVQQSLLLQFPDTNLFLPSRRGIWPSRHAFAGAVDKIGCQNGAVADQRRHLGCGITVTAPPMRHGFHFRGAAWRSEARCGFSPWQYAIGVFPICNALRRISTTNSTAVSPKSF